MQALAEILILMTHSLRRNVTTTYCSTSILIFILLETVLIYMTMFKTLKIINFKSNDNLLYQCFKVVSVFVQATPDLIMRQIYSESKTT
jgi:hypothetical protein